jgi:hypothetical protein
MARRQFDLLRACFLLLAIVILIVMFETLIVVVGCSWMIVIQRSEPLGACSQQGQAIREVLSELLTAILALIAASRGPPPPPPDDPPDDPHTVSKT